MFIKLSPVRSDKSIEYIYEDEVVIATIDGKSDTFDFSEVPDGKLGEVETSLPINPIVSAERIDGDLYVVLVNFISSDATEEERFPEWQEVDNDG